MSKSLFGKFRSISEPGGTFPPGSPITGRDESPQLSRRAVIRATTAAGAAAAAGVALTACGKDVKVAGANTGANAGAPAAGEASPDAGVTLAPASSVPVGGGAVVTPEGGQRKYVVGQPANGQWVGYSAICPHRGCEVNEVREGAIWCPCHGSQFNLADGSVKQGPATTGLDKVKVIDRGGTIVTA